MNVLATGGAVTLPGEVALADLGRGRPPALPTRIELSGRGLRYKDRATRLALCATAGALADAAVTSPGGASVDRSSVAVVVSSNLGNVDTVCRVVRTIAAGGAARTSPMDLPNASSNVIASSVAIWHGFQGPNLMVCNGATSGVDALLWAGRLLMAGRTDTALVIGVEPDTEEARRLTGRNPILDGAAAVVLERSDTASLRGARPRLVMGAHRRTTTLADCIAGLAGGGPGPTRWYLPDVAGAEVWRRLLPGVPAIDLSRSWGATSGALGVLQCAAAIGWFDGGGTGPVYAVNGAGGPGGAAGLVFRHPEDAALPGSASGHP